MTDSGWKVVMDGDGLTISGDTFSLTTNGADPRSLDTVVSELQGVARGTYGQYCGLSRAIEAVGERWGMLIVRDLLVSAKSTSELAEGLPGVPENLLSMRLREMGFCGIVEKAGTSDATGNPQYKLTRYGRELEGPLLAMGRWGSAMLNDPRPEDIITEDSMMVAMRAMFLADSAAGRSASYELHFGDIVINVVIDDGRIETGRGRLPGATVIGPGPHLKDMVTRRMTVAQAMATGTVMVPGGAAVMEEFVSMFGLPDLEAPQPFRD